MEARKKHLHYCAGKNCPGFVYKASERAHPVACCAEGRKAALARFADARKRLALASSSLNAVCDDGESVWSGAELLELVLQATAALKTITDVAELVSGEPLLGSKESLDQSLDAISAELTEKL